MSRFIRHGAIQLKAKFALANLMKKVTWYLFLANLMKKVTWYLFILTPLRIANKLALRLSLKGRVMTP